MSPNAHSASAGQAAMKQGVIALSACRGEQIEAEIASEKSVEQVVEGALAACAAQEEQLLTEARRQGSEAVSFVERELAGSRASALTYVQDRRAGRNLTNPVQAWGQCVGEFAGDHAGDNSAADAIAEAALASCKSLEAAAFASHPEMSINDKADAKAWALKSAADLVRSARSGGN
jgi:hypothetical protein